MADVIRKGFKDKDDNKIRIIGVPDDGKVDKIQSATAGNFAALTSQGGIEDSGVSPSDIIPLIVIRELSDLDDVTTAGLYRVSIRNGSTAMEDVMLSVTKELSTISQIIVRPTGYVMRSKSALDLNGWTSWSIVNYANAEHTHAGIYNAGSEVGINDNGMIRLIPKTGAGVAIIFGGNIVEINNENFVNLYRALQDRDTEPTVDSYKLLTSGVIYAALAGKMDAKTIDSAPAANADHLVSSQGVFVALAGKSDLNHIHSIYSIAGLDEYLATLSARVAALEDADTPVSWDTVEEIILGSTPGTNGQNRYSADSDALINLTHYDDFSVGDRVKLAGVTDSSINAEGEVLAKATGPSRLYLSIDLSSITNNDYHYNLQKVAASSSASQSES